MEDSEGVLSFDFEGGLDSGPANPIASIPAISSANHGATTGAAPNTTTTATSTATNSNSGAADIHAGRRSFRQTVCRHWLRSLCMKGDACGFLHQYDKSRMPVCRFFRLYGECREQDCVYKHTNEDIKECNMYKLGFCPNGPDCRYRHAKLPGPPPPVEEVVQKIQQLNSYNHGTSNKNFQQRNAGFSQQIEKSPNIIIKPSGTESANLQQQQQQQQTQTPHLTNGQHQQPQQPNPLNRIATPLPQGISRYFIVKSCNRENLELSVQQGVWATQRSNEIKLNEALDSSDNVILIFSVNRTRHFQGCAKMTSKIGASLCELSFHKTRHLRNPFNENLPVKISRDCQELEPSIGEQLASLLYLEPDSELMAISLAAEAKREEEKEKGVNPDSGGENPDIVPFEDNEEEEEEESEEEEEEAFAQPLGPAAQGRGRGRGMMWPSHNPMARGARPIPGIRGFPPMMMGADGFSYGAVAPDGFGMPDLFGVASRGFPPYGPRFSSDFTGAPSGMMFPGRPSQPGAVFPAGGYGMMMGPGRAPFIGGMGPTASNLLRGPRPGGMFAPFPAPSSQNNSRPVKRDQRAAANDRNDRHGVESDVARGAAGESNEERKYLQETSKASHEDQFGAVNSIRNDESESEDEAPRRSRHGEGKKKRRGSGDDATPGSDH
ncbi:30-kDa cleavage and polyadenylation specificity factor [Salix suchowensis]|nr:30-kDa cleavage and polyadenylation specificity factor [Salix suchowensis]